MWFLWLIVGITCSIAQRIYGGFFLIWFALGAFITFVLSFFISDNYLIQSIVFMVVSIISLATQTRKFAHKFTCKNTIPTSIDALIGKKGLVMETIGGSPTKVGLVKLDGETWPAVSLDQTLIEKGSTVIIHEIKGVRLSVTKVAVKKAPPTK